MLAFTPWSGRHSRVAFWMFAVVHPCWLLGCPPSPACQSNVFGLMSGFRFSRSNLALSCALSIEKADRRKIMCARDIEEDNTAVRTHRPEISKDSLKTCVWTHIGLTRLSWPIFAPILGPARIIYDTVQYPPLPINCLCVFALRSSGTRD